MKQITKLEDLKDGMYISISISHLSPIIRYRNPFYYTAIIKAIKPKRIILHWHDRIDSDNYPKITIFDEIITGDYKVYKLDISNKRFNFYLKLFKAN